MRAYGERSGRLPPHVSFREVAQDDEPFLRVLYASTREDEMVLVGWTGEKKEHFLDAQFEAQQRHYQVHFPTADHLVIEQHGSAVGRFYVDRREDELRLIDISLMPEVRNKGLGGALLQDLLEEGQERATPVRIHVDRFNPAMRLYLRLGFTLLEDHGIYDFLEWRPASS
jgi:GNAT superfamily N-acetyltransferase